ncbi:hypothetical protein ACQ858_08160 [Variovorax ureilyticus]|uniref:hypothetical protein n=1 Tax=Variovorax ureilyticus TaxID=1836198 RepID=UPI003D66557F
MSVPRKFVRFGDCKCILSKYCDGHCNPIFVDRTEAEQAAWLADKIVAFGDYAKEAAEMPRRWPSPANKNEIPDAGNKGAAQDSEPSEACSHDWRPFFTGPNQTHLICAHCEEKRPAPAVPRVEPDLIARGPGADEAESIIREAVEQAGYPWEKVDPLAYNIVLRATIAAHKAGFKLALSRFSDFALALESALSETIDKIIPGLDSGSILDDARTASAALSAATVEHGAVTVHECGTKNSYGYHIVKCFADAPIAKGTKLYSALASAAQAEGGNNA